MNLRIALVAGLLAVLAGVGWMTNRRVSMQAAIPAGAATTTIDVAAATDPRFAALRGSPEARAFRERQDFEAQARRFLQEAPKLGAVQRSEQARALTASIDRYERNGGLSAGEALLLRSGLIKATVEDPSLQAAQLADLMAGYRERADRRTLAYSREHARDPRFQDYKQRERAIVEQVMAMREIPGGLSRDEYLRQLLQQAREAAYR